LKRLFCGAPWASSKTLLGCANSIFGKKKRKEPQEAITGGGSRPVLLGEKPGGLGSLGEIKRWG